MGALWPGISLADSDDALAQRFRPYFKMSMGNQSGDEPYHPATWQWVVGNSTYRQGSSTVFLPNQWTPDFSGLLTHGGDLTQNPKTAHLHLDVGQYADVGEPWSSVIHQGDGLYAHVEHVSATQVNIEYTVLWPFNRPPGVPSQAHDGDVTTMVVVYDQSADLISRISYSAHGCILQVYQIDAGLKSLVNDLAGRDENFAPTETAVAQIDVAHAVHVVSNPCHGLTESESHVFLARDSVSGVYEHPVVFAEIGGHEFWPNGSGFLAAAGGHDGKGVSFLPYSVHTFPPFNDPQADGPFLHYNGLFGTDPHAIALHRTWCWAPACGKNPFGLVDSRFSDRNPYSNSDGLVWPPLPFAVGPRDVYVTDPGWQASGTGTQKSPFPGFVLAYSIAPSRSVLHIETMQGVPPMVLSRNMTIRAEGGPVVFGGLGLP